MDEAVEEGIQPILVTYEEFAQIRKTCLTVQTNITKLLRDNEMNLKQTVMEMKMKSKQKNHLLQLRKSMTPTHIQSICLQVTNNNKMQTLIL